MAFLSQEPLIEFKILSEKTPLLPHYILSSLFLFRKPSKNYVCEWWFCGQVKLQPIHEIDDNLQSSSEDRLFSFFVCQGDLLL